MKTHTENRVIFFDNLRYFLVICVVLQHAANAYNTLDWWPVADQDTSMIVGWLSAWFDTFTMPLIFYIAGYFALATMQKKDMTSFLKGKLRRMEQGAPLFVLFVSFCSKGNSKTRSQMPAPWVNVSQRCSA